MSALNPSQIQQLFQQMLLEKSALEEQLSMNASAADPVQLDQSAVGRVSRIDAIQQQHMAVSTRGQNKQRLVRINAAIAAIDSDDYGYCQSCDESIDFRRLQIQPEALLCIKCQQESDNIT